MISFLVGNVYADYLVNDQYIKINKGDFYYSGYPANAQGKGSIAIGGNTKVYGSYAVAIGENSQSHASYSVAVGANSQADESYEFSVGRDKIGEGEDKKAIYRQITHVANGTKAHDAVNLSQAKALIKEALVSGEIDAGNTTSSVTGAKIKAALDQKMDKSALNGYAKSSELATKANTSDLDAYAKADGSNVTTPATWATKLGTGEVATGNANLVTGGKVFDAIKDKADKSTLSDYAKASDLTTLKTQVTNITSGATEVDGSKINLATNTTFTALQSTVNGKANINADNITVSDWATKLGTGTVATGDANLVTGGTVFNAIKDKADKSALSDYAKASDLTTLKTQVTNITSGATEVDGSKINLATNNTFTTLQGTVTTLQNTVNGKANADGSNVTTPATWATKLGTGEVATGNANLVTGGKVFEAIKNKADKSELSDYAKAIDLTALKTQVTNITNGTTPVMTFTGTNGITATVSNNKITLGMNWADASAPKFHIYQAQEESSAVGRRRRARSVDGTSNIPGTKPIGSMRLDQLNMVFGEGLKAETKTENGTTYTRISLAENTGMSKFTVKTDEKDKTTQKEKTFDVDGSKAQLNVVGDGKNISTSIDKDNNTVKVSLKDDVSIKSLTAKTVTTDTVKVNDKVYLDKDGLHANNQVISDVKAGEKDSDAVNVGQLKALAGHTDKIGRAVGKLAVESRNGDALNAALSALRPLDYDPESKFDVSAGYGTYKGVHAMAVGTFYRPNATTLFSIGGSFTGGDSMMNAGVSFKVGSGSGSQTYLSRQAIASMLKRFSVEHEAMKNVLAEQDARIQAQIEALQKENSSLKDKVNRLEKENNDRIEKANNRIAELERQVKEVLINLKK